MDVSIDHLITAQDITQNIRNIALVAHVDHGKTTLSDCLISSNRIISERNAGKLKYLDYDVEEQMRMITMKSCSISLMHKKDGNDYLINLVDSPGHVDFTSEVGSALRIVDGAVVVVDAIEGVCIQTRNVLRQAWLERVKPVLVINKLDKLITEFQLDNPMDAYEHLKKILENVNEVASSLWAEELMNRGEEVLELGDEFDFTILADDGEYFSPSKGNVVFGCAYSGWGFRIADFAALYSKKLKVKKNILEKLLWGEYYFNPKNQLIHKKKPSSRSEPMFVQFILKTIWDIFLCVYPQTDEEKLPKVLSKLKITLSKREQASGTSIDLAGLILSKWIPLSGAIMSMVVDCVPNPIEAQNFRMSSLWNPELLNQDKIGEDISIDFIQEQHIELENSLMHCDQFSENLIAMVPKVYLVFNTQIDQSNPATRIPNLDPKGYRFVAMVRVFSGTLRRGDTVNVIQDDYNPFKPTQVKSFQVNELFVLMGASLHPTDHVCAGNICGIGNVSEFITKTATITSNLSMSPMNPLVSAAKPIVRVSVEPVDPSQVMQLREGLRILDIADPGCEIEIQRTGEHIVAATGELHLKKILKNLEEIYAKIPITVSEPLVSFRETVTGDLSNKLAPGQTEVYTAITPDHSLEIKIKAEPIPKNIRDFLEQNAYAVKQFGNRNRGHIHVEESETISSFREELEEEFQKAGPLWVEKYNQLWAFGESTSVANILLNSIPEYSDVENELWYPVHSPKLPPVTTFIDQEEMTDLQRLPSYTNSIITGFQISTRNGPLCEEPMMGVCFTVLSVEHLPENQVGNHGPITGQIISAMKDGGRKAFERKGQRLVEAFYSASVQLFGSEHLGKIYGVLHSRRAEIINEDIKDGTEIYEINAYLPAITSFGFADELFDKSSGAAHSQLQYSHWALLEDDPHFIPMTEDEKDEFGDETEYQESWGLNLARDYIDLIRGRKSLPLNRKTIVRNETRKTRSKKK